VILRYMLVVLAASRVATCPAVRPLATVAEKFTPCVFDPPASTVGAALRTVLPGSIWKVFAALDEARVGAARIGTSKGK
jgi:hypothetical protein